jgi:hypothetical protein
MNPRRIESAQGKTIDQLEIISLDGHIDVELRFTDKTCLHLTAHARAEVRIREFDAAQEVMTEHEPAVQETLSVG